MIRDEDEQTGGLVVYIGIVWAMILLSGLCGGLYYVLNNLKW
jgi:hypothetical protein